MCNMPLSMANFVPCDGRANSSGDCPLKQQQQHRAQKQTEPTKEHVYWIIHCVHSVVKFLCQSILNTKLCVISLRISNAPVLNCNAVQTWNNDTWLLSANQKKKIYQSRLCNISMLTRLGTSTNLDVDVYKCNSQQQQRKLWKQMQYRQHNTTQTNHQMSKGQLSSIKYTLLLTRSYNL